MVNNKLRHNVDYSDYFVLYGVRQSRKVFDELKSSMKIWEYSLSAIKTGSTSLIFDIKRNYKKFNPDNSKYREPQVVSYFNKPVYSHDGWGIPVVAYFETIPKYSERKLLKKVYDYEVNSTDIPIIIDQLTNLCILFKDNYRLTSPWINEDLKYKKPLTLMDINDKVDFMQEMLDVQKS